MERGRNITWYLHSEDSWTLGRISEVSNYRVDWCVGIVCGDGGTRNLMKTDYGLVAFLKKSAKKHEPFDFLVFRQEEEGPIDLFEGFPREKFEKEEAAFAARVKAMKRALPTTTARAVPVRGTVRAG